MVIKFVNSFNNQPDFIKKNYNITPDCFYVVDAEYWFQDGFESKEQYLNYKGYSYKIQ